MFWLKYASKDIFLVKSIFMFWNLKTSYSFLRFSMYDYSQY